MPRGVEEIYGVCGLVCLTVVLWWLGNDYFEGFSKILLFLPIIHCSLFLLVHWRTDFVTEEGNILHFFQKGTWTGTALNKKNESVWHVQIIDLNVPKRMKFSFSVGVTQTDPKRFENLFCWELSYSSGRTISTISSGSQIVQRPFLTPQLQEGDEFKLSFENYENGDGGLLQFDFNGRRVGKVDVISYVELFPVVTVKGPSMLHLKAEIAMQLNIKKARV